MKLEGIRELTVAISNAQRDSVDLAVKVTQNNSEELRREAKKLAPKDTWFMHDNITTRHFGMSSETISKAPYSGFVEFGTRNRNATPFMYPALNRIQPKYEKEMTNVMKGLFK